VAWRDGLDGKITPDVGDVAESDGLRLHPLGLERVTLVSYAFGGTYLVAADELMEEGWR
jgi:hypothetical protein